MQYIHEYGYYPEGFAIHTLLYCKIDDYSFYKSSTANPGLEDIGRKKKMKLRQLLRPWLRLQSCQVLIIKTCRELCNVLTPLKSDQSTIH